MDGRRRRSYKNVSDTIHTPPHPPSPSNTNIRFSPTRSTTCTSLFFIFFYFPISHKDLRIYYSPLFHTILGQWRRPILRPHPPPFVLPSPAANTSFAMSSARRWQHSFGYTKPLKVSQLIRSPTPFRDSAVLITVKELITGNLRGILSLTLR